MVGSVSIKGTKSGIVVFLSEQGEFAKVKQDLKDKLIDGIAFFAGAKVNVNFGGRELEEPQKTELEAMVKCYLGEETIVKFDYKETKGRIPLQELDMGEGITKFHKGTVRSGQTLSTKGNLVVIGDVNPGGVLIARGNIIVLGALKGMVHAGCDGNREAYVVALGLRPVQLRIADIITRAPDVQEERFEYFPEVAFIRNETIYIDAYLSKKNEL